MQTLKQYKVQAPDGKMITLEGPEGASQEEVIRQAQALYKPTEQSSAATSTVDQLKAIRAQQAAKYPTDAEKAARPVTPASAFPYGGVPGMMDVSTLVDTGKGAAKGLGSSAYNVTRAIPGVRDVMPVEKPDFLEPNSTAQKFGYGAEQIAEFAIPGAAVSKATKALPMLSRIAAEGLTSGAVGAAQGQSPEEIGVSGAIGAVTPAIAPVWPAVKDFVSRKVTPRMLNSLMEVKPQWLELGGRDPGGRIAKEGIVAGSKDGLLTQVVDKGKEAGRALEAALVRDGAGKSIDGSDIVVNALDNATKRIGIGSDKAFQGQLEIVLTDILKEAKDISRLSPLEAQRLKSKIGDSIKWTGVPYEADVNKALLEIYRGLNNATEHAVPGAKALLARYGDLKVAENALTASVRKDMTKPIASGQGIFANVMRLAGNAPVKTGMAQATETLMNPASSAFSDILGRLTGGAIASGQKQ